MSKMVKNDQWVWILILNPGGDEQILGQHDDSNDISFIPCFLEKEQAQKCYHLLTGVKENKNEFQAIIFEDLTRYAVENRFDIFILNESGEIQEKIVPSPPEK